MDRYNFAETGMGYKRLQYDPKGEWIKYDDAKDAFNRGFDGGIRNSAEMTIRRLTHALEKCESVLKACEREKAIPQALKEYIADANKSADKELKEAWSFLK